MCVLLQRMDCFWYIYNSVHVVSMCTWYTLKNNNYSVDCGNECYFTQIHFSLLWYRNFCNFCLLIYMFSNTKYLIKDSSFLYPLLLQSKMHLRHKWLKRHYGCYYTILRLLVLFYYLRVQSNCNYLKLK